MLHSQICPLSEASFDLRKQMGDVNMIKVVILL